MPENETNDVVLTPCDSSFISGYAYNEKVWVFTIQFRNGPTKAYQDVEPEVYEDFLDAESKGKWFNATMKHNYKSLVIEGVDPVEAPVHAETSKPDYSYQGENGIVDPATGHVANKDMPAYEKMVAEATDDETDPTLELATTDSHGENLPPLETPKTVTDALRLLSENAGLIQATIEQNARIAKTAAQIAVKDAESYEKAGNEVIFLTTVKDRSTGFLDPIRALLLKPYQVAQQKLKEAVTPLDESVSILKRRRLDWHAAQEAIRLEKQRQAQAEADRQAEESRKAASVQLTIGEIDNALAQGDEKLAEALLEKPIEAPGVYQPPVHIESDVPKTKGLSRREKWVIEVTNFEDMILSVAEGICSMRDGKGLMGHAPVNFLKENETAIKDMAKAQKKSFSYPGIRAWDEGTEATRRKK